MRRPTLVLCLLAGCAGPGDDNDLLDRLREDDYRGWARAPEWPDPLLPAAGGPHGSFLDIYVNDVLADALAAGTVVDTWPEGSIIAKDAWRDAEGEDLRFLAVMEKEGDAWFWAEYDGDDEIVVAGLDDSSCTGCHDAGADGVLAFGFPQ